MPSDESYTSPETSPDGDVLPGRLYLRALGDACLLRVPPSGDPEKILGPGKPFAVLTYLVSSPGRSAVRDQLVDLLWSNLDLESARHALRQALWYLRQRLGRRSIHTRHQEIVLRTEVESDRDAFLDAVERADFERAVELYQGEFLPVFAAPGGAGFERWQEAERYRLRTHFLRAGGSLVWEHLAQGRVVEAKHLATRIRDADRLDEAGWRLLLEVLLTADDRTQARIEARAMEEWLEEMEREPEPAVQRLLAAAQDLALEPAEARAGSRLHPELIGREREFALILARWRSATAARGVHVHVTGAAGLGKSRLLAEAADRLEQMGAELIALRAHPGRRDVGYALVSELASELANLPGAERVSEGSAGALVALNPSLSERFGQRRERASGEEALRHREIALSELMGSVAEREPLAILIDDVHWADPASRRVLRSLCSRVSNHQILMVTTARPAVEGFPIQGPDAEPVRLEALSEQETEALLASLGTLPDEQWAEDFPSRLSRVSGGLPLRMLETLRLVLDEDLLSLTEGNWACPDPTALRDALERGGASGRRIEDLPGRQQEILLLLCVTGTPLGVPELAVATGRTDEEVLHDLYALEVRDLVTHRTERWAPVHDEIVDTTLELLGEERVRDGHRAMGRTLEQRAGNDPDTMFRAARHLACAGESDLLEKAFTGWVEQVRSQGDLRPVQELAVQTLGTAASDDSVRRLVSTLPTGLRLGLTTRVVQRIALAGGGFLVLVAVLVGLLMPTERVPLDASLLVLVPSPDGRTLDGYELPIRRLGWEELEGLDVPDGARPIPALRGLPATAGPVLGDSERGWLYAAVTAETWGPDLFYRAPDGEERRLTHFPGDDRPEALSPDGRSVVLTTSRWDPDYWHDLAILDLDTWETRALTRTPYDDGSPIWSPDGTRIAFERRTMLRAPGEVGGLALRQLCWITPDGTTEQCLGSSGDGMRPVGWTGPSEVVAIRTTIGGGQSLVRVHLGTGQVRVIEERVTAATVSPDGRWTALWNRAGREAWEIFPMDRPDLKVPLPVSGGGETKVVSWLRAGPQETYLARLELLLPDTLLQGIPTRLRARGFDAQGRGIALPLLSWKVDDTLTASVDSGTDVVEAKTLGEVTLLASAGGWREASRRVPVSVPAHRPLWEEDWVGELTHRWVPFGNPPPAISSWVRRGRAFFNRGDGFYASGIYSKDGFDGSAGHGMEAWVSTPITAARAQRISLGFHAWRNPEALNEWDHRIGGLPGATARCTFVYPPGDGFDRVELVSGAGQVVRVSAGLATGEPYRVRIQVFPDGSCGVALDGEPLARTEVRTRAEVPDRIVIAGSSLGSRVLVGPLEVWQGVRADIDWSALGWTDDGAAWIRLDRGTAGEAGS